MMLTSLKFKVSSSPCECIFAFLVQIDHTEFPFSYFALSLDIKKNKNAPGIRSKMFNFTDFFSVSLYFIYFVYD